MSAAATALSTVWIIMVNYRTPALVLDSLRSIAPQRADLNGGRVLVVDNASGDGSVAQLAAAIAREGWAGWAQVMAVARNGGFAYGNNAGLREALNMPERPEFLLLLNPDTLVHPGAIGALSTFLTAHPHAGIAGSLLTNETGRTEVSAHRLPSPLGELDGAARLGLLTRLLAAWVVSPPQPAEAHRCDWVSGASFMLRRSVVEQVGLMDEGYFLYFEEVDYCARAGRAGWEVWHVPASQVVHLEGAATGIRSAARRPRYWYESRRRFFLKHFGAGGLLLADALWGLGRISLLLRRMLGLAGRGARQGARDPERFALDLLGGDLQALWNGQARRIGAQDGGWR